MPVWSTEFNYWLDNPLSDNKSKLSDYGISYATSGCSSKAGREFIYDYAEAVMTAMYAHENSCGILSTSYPHGQIGYFFGWVTNTSPMGEAFEDLVGKEWHTPDQNGTATGGKFNIKNAALGKYEVKVTYGNVTKTFNVDLSKGSNAYMLKFIP